MPIKVIMGSASDFDFVRRIRDEVIRREVPYSVEFWVKSAHRYGGEIPSFIDETETGEPTVYVTSAGGSDGLTGATRLNTVWPVLVCAKDAAERGEAKKYSSVAIPDGALVSYHFTPEEAAAEAIELLGKMKPLKADEYWERKETVLASRDKPRLYQQKVLESVAKFDLELIDRYLNEGKTFHFPMYPGKVRRVFTLGNNLLVEATDNVSIFDVVLPTPVKYKGVILTKTSNWWTPKLEDIVQQDLIAEVDPNKNLVKKVRRIDIEAVVRGYLFGSAWDAYAKGEPICGITLPTGLSKAEKLSQPIFTPATKEVSEGTETVHDVNVSKDDALIHLREQFPTMTLESAAEIVNEIEEISLKCYEKAVSIAGPKGIIYADTKFEFGLIDGGIIMIDERLTQDSSRIWVGKFYDEMFSKGLDQISFDKQPVRDYGTKIGWNKKLPGPPLPPEISQSATERYANGYLQLTDEKLDLENITVRPLLV